MSGTGRRTCSTWRTLYHVREGASLTALAISLLEVTARRTGAGRGTLRRHAHLPGGPVALRRVSTVVLLRRVLLTVSPAVGLIESLLLIPAILLRRELLIRLSVRGAGTGGFVTLTGNSVVGKLARITKVAASTGPMTAEGLTGFSDMGEVALFLETAATARPMTAAA